VKPVIRLYLTDLDRKFTSELYLITLTFLCSTHISGDEFFNVIDTLDKNFTLADHVIVIWVGGDEESLWRNNITT